MLVVGAGPAGAAAAYWLATGGHDVQVVEARAFPRTVTCGDALTPRAVHQLHEMGLADALAGSHRHDGLRISAHGRTVEVPWPDHPTYPDHGYVVRRDHLDQLVADHAAGAGARIWTGTEALRPLVEDGLTLGAVVSRDGDEVEVRADYLVVADGALSRFGRSLGSARNRGYPHGSALRRYHRSELGPSPWLETDIGLTDRQGAALPGCGWVFPLGDGTVNAGVGLLSTFRDFSSVDTADLLDGWMEGLPADWGLSPEGACGPAEAGRLPMGGSVMPKVGPTHLLVGDAAGVVNPLNGSGLDTAYETGRLAAEVLHEALATGDGLVLQDYPRRLEAELGRYFKLARVTAALLGRPAVVRALTTTGIRSRSLLEWTVRIGANLLRPDERRPAELAYRAATRLARLVPEKTTP